MDSASLIPGPVAVTIADTTTVSAAYIADDRWNGFAIPYLDRAAADDLVGRLHVLDAESPLMLKWADDGVTILESDPEGWSHQPDGEGEDDVHSVDARGLAWWVNAGPIEIDGVPHWSPGSYGWTWTTSEMWGHIEGATDDRAFPIFDVDREAHGLSVAWIPGQAARFRADRGDLSGVTADDGSEIRTSADLVKLPTRGGLIGIRARWEITANDGAAL